MTARFERFAETYLQVTLRGGAEWMCRCPLHDDNGASLQFNVHKGLWVCFGCQQGGSAKSLAKRMNVSFEEPSVPLDELSKQLNAVIHPVPKHSPVILPETYLKRFAIDHHEYWDKRGFTEQSQEEFGLGYDFMQDQLTIPFRNPEGELLGVIRRRLDNGFPRYLYPKGFDRMGSLFASWKWKNGPLVLVEGSLDAVMCWQNTTPAMAIYGSSIHPRQVQLLRRLGVKEVVLFFDYDTAGMAAAKRVADYLDGFVVRRVEWDSEVYCWRKECNCTREHRPDPGSLKDPLDMAEVLSRIELTGSALRIDQLRKQA